MDKASLERSGFRPMKLTSEFLIHNGPIYGKRDDGRITTRFIVERTHCNHLGICHGGMLMTFCDTLLVWGVINSVVPHRVAKTLSLTFDFVAAAKLADCIEGVAETLRVSGNLGFAQAVLKCDDRLVLRASGVYKLAEQDDPKFHQLFEEIFS